MRKIVTICLAILFIWPFAVIPAWSDELGKAFNLSRQASQLMYQGKDILALPLAERALPIIEKHLSPDHPNVALTVGLLGTIYVRLGKYDKAEHYIKRSLALNEKLYGPYYTMVATELGSLASLYMELGDCQRAVPLVKRALAINEKIHGPESPEVALSFLLLSSLYYELGEFNQVEVLDKRALAIYTKAYGPEHPRVAVSLNNLGVYYTYIGDYEKAVDCHKRALAIYENDRDPNNRNVAISLQNLALLYQRTGDYEKAEAYFKRALDILEETLGKNHPLTITSLINLGCLYLATERWFYARYCIAKLHVRQHDAFGLEAEYFRLYLRNLPDKAEKLYFKDIKLNNGKGKKPDMLISDHIGLGHLYEGQRKYASAKVHFKEAIVLSEKQWLTMPSQTKKNFMTSGIGINFTRLDAYEGLIRVLLKENDSNTARDSFAIAEQVKGRVFLEMLATRQLRGKTGQDASVIEKDKTFQQTLLSLQKQIEKLEETEDQTSIQELKRLKIELYSKEKEYSNFIEEVKLKSGELSTLLTVDPISPSKLQSLLDPSTTLLEYFIAKDKTYAWLVTKNSIKAYTLPLTNKDLRRKVDTLLMPDMSTRAVILKPIMLHGDEKIPPTEQERQENRQHFEQLTRDFYKDILSPLERDIKTKNLIIVPHGVLHKVPFAALSDGQQYLVDKYSISVLPSASILQYVANKRKKTKASALVLANPTTGKDKLVYAEQEGKTISKLFSGCTPYVRDQATKTVAMTKSPFFNVIHFATHGEFNERQPLQSGLLLAGGRDNDGFLQVHDIFSMDLKNANLVTLSACETALAKIQGGDDLVGLSRGFIYAGTPSLLATLWQVDDQSTSIIMESFYKNWLQGMSKPEALRQAQIALKNMPTYRHPYYWAAFEMIGDYQ